MGLHPTERYTIQAAEREQAKVLGWEAPTELDEGIRLAYEDFLNNPMRAEK